MCAVRLRTNVGNNLGSILCFGRCFELGWRWSICWWVATKLNSRVLSNAYEDPHQAIFRGSAPALSMLLKAYIPWILGSSRGDWGYQSCSREQPLPKLSPRTKITWSGHRGPDPTTSAGSQEDIFPNGSNIMRTDLHMEVESGKMGEAYINFWGTSIDLCPHVYYRYV